MASAAVAGRGTERLIVVDVCQRPTRRQVEVLHAYIVTGSITAAARELDVADPTARQHLSGLNRRIGCLNAAQAAYLLGTGRWAQAGRSQGDPRSDPG